MLDGANFCAGCGAAVGAESRQRHTIPAREYWVPAGTLRDPKLDTVIVDDADLRRGHRPLFVFHTRRSPMPGEKVPSDSAWSSFAYPGPIDPAVVRLRTKQARLAAIGALRGRPAEEIVRFIGPPDSYVMSLGGRRVSSWTEVIGWSAWSCTLLFDPYEVCIGVISESTV